MYCFSALFLVWHRSPSAKFTAPHSPTKRNPVSPIYQHIYRVSGARQEGKTDTQARLERPQQFLKIRLPTRTHTQKKNSSQEATFRCAFHSATIVPPLSLKQMKENIISLSNFTELHLPKK